MRLKIMILAAAVSSSAFAQTRPTTQAVADILDRAKADALAIVQSSQGATSAEVAAARASEAAARADIVAAKADKAIAQAELDRIRGQVSDQVQSLGIIRQALIATTRPSTPTPTTPATQPSSRTLEVGPAKAYTTIAAASAASAPGDTIRIDPGVYREAIRPVKANVTYAAAQIGTVTIDGAVPLSGFTRVTADKPVWSTAWSSDFFIGGTKQRFHLSPAPLGCAEQFLWSPTPAASTGAVLRQVMSAGELAEGTFFVDWTGDRVQVWLPGGADPATGTLLGSRLSRLAGGNVAGVKIVGINFRHAANFAQPEQAAVLAGDGWELTDIAVEKAGAAGVAFQGDGIKLLRVVSRKNGQQGLGGSHSTGVQIVDCQTLDNNTKGWNPSVSNGECGGGKVAYSHDVQITNLLSQGNRGPGFWFDIDNTDFRISRSTFRGTISPDVPSNGPGLFIELTQGDANKPGQITDCVFENNAGAGLLIGEAANLIVAGNTFRGNGTASIDLRQGSNPDGTFRAGPSGTYKVAGVTITGNTFEGRGIQTTGAAWKDFTPAGNRISINGNRYKLAAGLPLIRWFQTNYTIVGDLRLKTGLELAGLAE